MKNKKAVTITVVSIILFYASIYCFYRIFFYYPDLTIRVEDLYTGDYDERTRAVQVGDEYFIMENGNICNASDKRIIYSASDENTFMKSYCDLLWIYDKNSRDNLKAFDKSGNIVKSYAVSQHITDFLVSRDMIFCEIYIHNRRTNCNSIKLYQMLNDENIKVIPIEYSLVHESENSDFKLYKYSCEYGECLFFDKNSDNYFDAYFAYDSDYKNLIRSQKKWYDLLHIEQDRLVYTDDINDVRRYSEYSFANETEMEYEISKENDGAEFFPNKLFYADEDTVISVAQNCIVRRIARHPPVNYDDKMEFHKNDVLFLFDTDNFSEPAEFKTKTFERIIYADSERVITYYNGKYITYSLDGWKKIHKQKAEEIENGGSYIFEACGEYIFVFDDNTGKMINRIKIKE